MDVKSAISFDESLAHQAIDLRFILVIECSNFQNLISWHTQPGYFHIEIDGHFLVSNLYHFEANYSLFLYHFALYISDTSGCF